MAIIKCPECGHQISDKAPTCPSCGVEIKGKIIKCPVCGEVYLYDQEMCPNCHHANFAPIPVESSSSYVREEPNPRPIEDEDMESEIPFEDDNDANSPSEERSKQPKRKKETSKKRKNYSALIVAFVLALIILAVSGYFYNKTKTEQEANSYGNAMSSKEPIVLQSYLDQNPDAPKAHRDSVLARIKFLQEIDKDWTDVVASGSKTVLLDYLEKNPKSSHRDLAFKMIDSIDWEIATKENTVEAYDTYAKEHPQGQHYDAAVDASKMLQSNTLLPGEKDMVNNIIRRFFQSINDKDEKKIQSTVGNSLTNFLGKSNQTKGDVSAFVQRQWKPDFAKVTWHILGDYKINKKPMGDSKFQYDVQATATKRIERKDKKAVPEAKYRLNATVNSDTTIVALDLTKIIEEKKDDDKAKKN